jgi:hypothetical protein
MSKLRFVVLLLVLCAAAMPQTRILLYDFEARGVDVSVVRANTQVLRDALNGTYKYVVIDPPPGTFCYNVLAAADSAKKYGAAQVLIGNIMAVGGKQFLTYQLVDAASSTLMLADKFDLPPMDEFPTMAERVATSIVEKKPYMETIEPGKILETEAAGPWFKHPRKPYAGILMTAGYNYLFVQRPETYLSNRLVSLNVAVSFETQHMLTMLQIGYMRGVHDERDIAFDLLSHYVSGTGDFAPFYGGGVGITRFLWTEPGGPQEDNDALVLSAGGGVIGLRTYYFRLVAAGYLNLAIAGNPKRDWPLIPGVKVLFGVSSPSFGPDATIKTSPGCIGAAIGAVFLTGLVLMLTG